jgi:phosphoglucosamine mutase
MSNYGIERAIAGLGVEFLRADVGDRYVLQVLKQRGGVLGGEASGHLLCLDKVSTGDGIVAALLVLEALQRLGMTLKQARGNVHRVPQTTVNVRVASGAALVAAESVQRVLALAQQQMRGRGRVVLRPSGTEPLVRVTVEGEDAEEIGALASSMADAVKSASGQMAD